jgi:hypothetical protein
MASFETQRSTRTVVILTKPEEWSLWLFQHKYKAVLHGVWKYCDSSVSAPPVLYPKPERSLLPQGDLTGDIIQEQRIRLSEWEWVYKEWNQKDKVLCKRLDLCWPQWVHFGSQEHHRTSWNPMESHGTSWNPMEPHGTSWNPTEPHGRFWNMAESSGC